MKRSATLVFTLVGILSLTLLVVPAAGAETRQELLPVHGFDSLVRLLPGDSGDDVAALQTALAKKGFYPYEVDGEYGNSTSYAVIAFHKYLGLERTSTFNALDWIRLEMLPDPGLPDRWDETDYIEVDLTRQLLFLVKGGELVRIVPVSTGGGYTYTSPRSGSGAVANTPTGDFHLKWRQYGWVCDPVTTWCVYKYWAFTDYYGIHGYRSVPSYPASHGCVRVTTWDADWLADELAVGMPVHIWREPPTVAPPPVDPPSVML